MAGIGKKIVSLFGEITADTSGLKRGLDEAKSMFKMTEGQLSQLGDIAGEAGKKMSLFVTMPIMGSFYKMIDAASDLSETMNKVDVVFGDSAASVKQFGMDAAQSLGMSKQTALEAAGTFGNLFTSMGLAADQSAEMSTEIVTLAADLASFNNIDPTVALEKLRAGLVGEVEPLRTLGVNLSAAAVEIKAVEMGLISQGEELNAAAKAQASYALILEQTTNAQGDFARTSDGLANSTRIMKAEIGDAFASMGENLLPVALSLTKEFTGLIGVFTDMDPAAQKMVLGMMAIAAATGPALIGISKLITAIPILKTELIALQAAGLGPLAIAAGTITALFGAMAIGIKSESDRMDEATSSVLNFDLALEKGIITQNEYKGVTMALMNGNWEAAQAQEWLATKWSEYVEVVNDVLPVERDSIRNTREAADAAYAHAASLRDARDATDDSIASTRNLNDEMAELQSFIDGRLGPEIDNFTDAQSELDNEIAGVIARINELASIESPTAEQSAELAELQTQYSGLKQQYSDNAEAHAEATRSILFDLLTQRAALDGLSSDELEILTTIAYNWGLVDEATRNATMEMDTALTALANGAGKDEVLRMLEEIRARAESISGSYDIWFNVDYSGLPGTSSNNVYVPPGTYDAEWASGVDSFVVPAGYPNDSFTAGLSSGEVVTVDKSGSSGGGDTYNITLNTSGGADGIELYRQFKQALEMDMRAAERGGVQTSDY